MDPEYKKILDEVYSLSKENNEMLHKIRSIQKWQSFTRIAYWVLILAVSYGAYIYTQPYLKKAMDVIHTSQADLDKIRNIGDKFNFQ